MPEEGGTNAGVGLIYPPPDIRGVIDKTAQFVAKCGAEFEQRVLREQNHAKFAFLLPNNPYRAYYDNKIKEFETGKVEETKPEVPQAIIDMKKKETEKQKNKEQQKALTDGRRQKKVAKQPPPDQFILNHPYITSMDTDMIKLTAQFVARNGQKFLIGLTQRESRNPQFDFLKPTHALFGYFTSLVDSYTKCLMPSKDELERLKRIINNPQEIMDKALARYAWDEQEEEKRINREEQDKEEKDQMAQIDWHDFVVVETITFTAEDDNITLAPPLDTSTGAPKGPPQALDASTQCTVMQEARIEKPKEPEEDEDEAEADAERERQRQKESQAREREEREKEEREKEERERTEREREEREKAEMAAPDEDDETLELEQDIPMPSADAEMKVRKDYVRHKKSAGQRLMQRCPITGQLIPAEEMSTHLKILLLDPKWKHQKDALVERARKESAFADDVEANLAGFVAKRPDLFGSVDEQIREAAEAGAEAAARDAGADAGPAHTMVPPSMALSGGMSVHPKVAALPSTAGGVAALPGIGGVAASSVGPIAGISTINARLPQAALAPPPSMQPPSAPAPSAAGVTRPIGNETIDDDDEPDAKRPRLDDGSMTPESQWIVKHPSPIAVLVQVNLGSDGLAAQIPQVIPLEVSVRMKVLELKQLLLPRVQAAGVTLNSLRLKAPGPGYILKNDSTLALYNVAPGNVIELTKRTRGN